MTTARRLGRYEVLVPIGTGGMATVWVARFEVVPGAYRDVAIKAMHAKLGADGDLGAQVIAEARVASRIRHANVVAVHEVGSGLDGPFLVMDYVEGPTLSWLVREALRTRERIPVGIVARIVHDALGGLHAAHELVDDAGAPVALVHRDFSPQNVLVGVDGIARLTDFGIAKALGAMGATATGMVKGKVGYMAPEQALAEPIDRRSDVWAAGVVLWEALAHQRLFNAESDAATLLKVVGSDPIAVPSTVRAEVPPEVDAVVAGALQRRIDRRTTTALAMRDALAAAAERHGGLPSREEVARYVERVARPTLEERAARVRAVLAERHAQRSPDPTLSGPTDATLDPGGTSARMAATAPAADARRGLVGAVRAIAIAAAVTVVAVAGLAAARRSAATTAAVVPAPSDAVVAEGTAPPTGAVDTATVTPPPASADRVGDRTLRIEADGPIAQLRLGARSVVLAEPVARLDVALTELEASSALLVSAVADDGRRGVVEVAPGLREARLEFSATRAAARPARPAAASSRAPDKSGLAPSPYGNP